MGARLRAARHRARYGNLKDFAPLVGRKPRHCYDYERGRIVPPREVIEAWAVATGEPLADLMGEDTDRFRRRDPGLIALKAPEAAPLRERLGITPGEMTDLEQVLLPPGYIMQTVDSALAQLQALRLARPPAGPGAWPTGTAPETPG